MRAPCSRATLVSGATLTTSNKLCKISLLRIVAESDIPIVGYIASHCSKIISCRGFAAPAMRITYDTEGLMVAVTGAISAPRLCPIKPIERVSTNSLLLRKSTAYAASSAWSRMVALKKLPSDSAAPLSSYLKTAKPVRVRKSDITRNVLWPKIVWLRSDAPDPEIKTTAGYCPSLEGVVIVPFSLIPSFLFRNSMSSEKYGRGSFGSWGLSAIEKGNVSTF
ncbi:hypothetical protein SDC9_76384 [bioreactor metagenome]|uniref:Uncharacterized protein n=1 Tax=bioreactor metagenome TaxID=1076179 RepID=A0A644YTP5_9ZZZZ